MTECTYCDGMGEIERKGIVAACPLCQPSKETEWIPISEAPKGEDHAFGQVYVDLYGAGSRFTDCFYDWESGFWTMRVRYLTKSGARKTVFNCLKTNDKWFFKPLPQPPKENE